MIVILKVRYQRDGRAFAGSAHADALGATPRGGPDDGGRDMRPPYVSDQMRISHTARAVWEFLVRGTPIPCYFYARIPGARNGRVDLEIHGRTVDPMRADAAKRIARMVLFGA